MTSRTSVPRSRRTWPSSSAAGRQCPGALIAGAAAFRRAGIDQRQGAAFDVVEDVLQAEVAVKLAARPARRASRRRGRGRAAPAVRRQVVVDGRARLQILRGRHRGHHQRERRHAEMQRRRRGDRPALDDTAMQRFVQPGQRVEFRLRDLGLSADGRLVDLDHQVSGDPARSARRPSTRPRRPSSSRPRRAV